MAQRALLPKRTRSCRCAHDLPPARAQPSQSSPHKQPTAAMPHPRERLHPRRTSCRGPNARRHRTRDGRCPPKQSNRCRCTGNRWMTSRERAECVAPKPNRQQKSTTKRYGPSKGSLTRPIKDGGQRNIMERRPCLSMCWKRSTPALRETLPITFSGLGTSRQLDCKRTHQSHDSPRRSHDPDIIGNAVSPSTSRSSSCAASPLSHSMG